jgi:adenylate cyclase
MVRPAGKSSPVTTSRTSCVSRGVHDHLRHRGGMVFEDLGEQLVKNIAHPIRAFRLRVGADTSDQDVSGRLIPGAPEGPTDPTTISELSVESEVSLEIALWEGVKDGNLAELESYLEQYPDGTLPR